MNTDNFLSESEVSVNYGISKSFLQRHRTRGSGPSYMIYNGRILYPLKETEDWLIKNKKIDIKKLNAEKNLNNYLKGKL